MTAEGKEYRISKKYYLLGAVGAFLFLLLYGFMVWFGQGEIPIIYFVIILAGILFSVRQLFTFIRLVPNGVQVTSGIFAKKIVFFPYSEIQDVSEYSDLLARVLDVKTLTIRTRSPISGTNGNLIPLDAKESNEITQMILSHAKGNSKSDMKAVMQDQKSIQETGEISGKKNLFPIHAFLGALNIVFLLGILIVLVIVVGGPLAGFVFGLGLLFFLPFVIGAVAFQYLITHYIIGNNQFMLYTDFLQRRTTTAAYSMVQDVTLAYNFFERFIGIASVTINTGAQMINVSKTGPLPYMTVPALKNTEARKLVNILLEKMKLTSKPAIISLREKFPFEKKIISIRVMQSLLLPIVIIAVILLGIEKYWYWIPIYVIVRVLVEYFYYQELKYEDREDSFLIHKGIIFTSEMIVPYRHVQQIYVKQSWMERLLQLYHVQLSTISLASQQMAVIEGMTASNANALVAFLKKKMDKY